MVNHSVDTQLFQLPESKHKLKVHFGYDPAKIDVLTVAGMYPVKGIHVLIEAIHHDKRLKACDFHLVCSGGDPRYRKKIELMIAQYGITNLHIYGPCSRDELAKRYQAADFYLQPSLKEGFGLAIAEAASCGLPVLATKSGGPEDIVTDAIGRLCAPNDSRSLADHIFEMSQFFHTYSPTNINTYVMSRFSPAVKLAAIKEGYRKAVKSARNE